MYFKSCCWISADKNNTFSSVGSLIVGADTMNMADNDVSSEEGMVQLEVRH